MKLREIVTAIHVPYRKVVYWLVSGGSLAFWAAFWLPSSFYFVYYVAVAVMLAGMLYLAYWVYRAGYRKQALMMGIGYVALFAIAVVVLKWGHDGLYGG